MRPYDFSVCCRRLVEAFRAAPDAQLDSTFFLGFGEDGAPIYKLGSLQAGSLSTTFTEPLVFCPFCGSRVAAGAGAPALEQTVGMGEELTLLAGG